MLKCVITVVIDGSRFCDIWGKYYSRYFDNKDIYILDIGDGRATKNLPYNVIPVNLPQRDWSNLNRMSEIVNDYKNILLKQYDWVVFADSDEIIYHPNGLDEYIKSLKADYVTCKGYDITQNLRDEHVKRGIEGLNLFKEGPIDWEKPILSQRKYWQANTAYNKTLITSVEFKWSKGLHVCDRPQNIDHRLWLLHLKKIDYAYCEQLNQKYRKIGEIHSALNSRKVGEDFRRWWVSTSHKLTPIPEHIRESLAF